ncbi:MAG: acetolactate decarboxylase [Clostridia bacterium]|nr:acetolactate decarboxylase [Clostridia bacterium]
MSKMIQASTLNALMLGNFDRTISVKEFLHNADTGLGTYTGLDGEAIFEDGVAYRATAEGKVSVMRPEDGVAFGTVARFDESVPEFQLTGVDTIEALKRKLEPHVVNPNAFYLFKAHGEFDAMHVRSCFACEKPYPTLSEAASQQREFHYVKVRGDVIAVYCPAYVNGINMPGWHFHFLSGDKTMGGHILGLSAASMKARVNELDEYEIILPRNEEFAKLNLCEDLTEKTAAVEGGARKA